jgi:hypothetical protein
MTTNYGTEQAIEDLAKQWDEAALREARTVLCSAMTARAAAKEVLAMFGVADALRARAALQQPNTGDNRG